MAPVMPEVATPGGKLSSELPQAPTRSPAHVLPSRGDREPNKLHKNGGGKGGKGQQERYVLNVRGQRYEIEKSLCSPPAAPDALLACLDAQHGAYCERRGEYFFNRDPVIFNCILSFYVTGKLHFPSSICPDAIRAETQFWGVPDSLLADCCWERMYDDVSMRGRLARLEEEQRVKYGDGVALGKDGRPLQASLPDKIFWTLDCPQYSKLAWIYSWLSVCVLVVSIVSLIISTHRELRSMLPLAEPMAEEEMGNQSTYLTMYRHSTPVTTIIFIENVTILFFVVELTIKVACCCCCCGGGGSGGVIQRWRRLCKFFTLLDVCIIAPNVVLFILSLVYLPEVYTQDEMTESSEISSFLYIIETLRFVRVLRLLRVVQQFPAMRILYVALASSYRELLILIALLIFLDVIWGAVIFYAELATDTFHGIGYGMWWALVTMTTVGYGDYFPKSGGGYFVGTLCVVSGILILALPIPVITNNFNTYYRLYQFLGRIRARDTCQQPQREDTRQEESEGASEDGDADLKDTCERNVEGTRVECITTTGSVA